MSKDPSSLAALALTTTSKTTQTASASNVTTTSTNKLASSNEHHDDHNHANNQNIRHPTSRSPQRTPLKSFSSTDEFIAGWVAALINTSALFPINKLIFRQMAGGHKTLYAADQMKEEGLRYLYRGILPPLIQKMVTVSVMFGSFSHYREWADRKFTNSPPIANLALAAILTGSTEAVLTPLERIQMLLQDRSFHKNYKNTLDALLKLRMYGYAEYYRGLTCVLMRNGPSNILFFGLRDNIKELLQTWSKQFHNNHYISQSQSNYSNSKLSPDLEQLTSGDQSTNQNPFHNTQTVTNPTTTIENIVGTQRKATNEGLLLAEDSIIYDFLTGAILGACISTLFYPLSVVRTRMQTRAPGTEFLSIVKAFKAVYSERDRKFSRLFHGCSINVLRQFVSWGVINCSYEFVLDFLHNNNN